MPKEDIIVNLPGFIVKKVTEGNPIILDVHYKIKPFCSHCLSKNYRIKASFSREVNHIQIGNRNTKLRFTSHKFYCKTCHRYFNQRFNGILPKKRSSEPLRKQVSDLHNKGVDQKTLACSFHLGKSTVEKWHHDNFVTLNKELQNRECPRVLGIDEHFFSKKEGYATTFCNLKKHRVFDVVLGTTAAELHDFFMSLNGREKVEVVCIDMSSNYRSLIRKYFPNAKIVADRFHVIAHVNKLFIKTCREIDPNIKNNRGILAMLRKKPENLTKSQAERLKQYLKKYPAINAVYLFKQDIDRLLNMKKCTAKKCQTLIPTFLKYIDMLTNSGFHYMKKLGNTFINWQEEIVRMWRFSKSNGITEGFHRKMKLIQRKAFGFKNFENYRLRVRILCA